jgi:hypothetical protein
MNTNITLNPAKPYDGNAQFAAVGAAIKKLIAAGVVAEDTRYNRQSGKVTASVDGRGTFSDGKRGWKAARIEFGAGIGGRISDAAVDKIISTVIEHLTAAGWQVSKAPSPAGLASTDGWASYNIVGTGFTEYTKAEIKRLAQIDELRLDRQRQIAADEAEVRQILADFGIERPHFHNGYFGSVGVVLTLDDIRRIVAGEDRS